MSSNLNTIGVILLLVLLFSTSAWANNEPQKAFIRLQFPGTTYTDSSADSSFDKFATLNRSYNKGADEIEQIIFQQNRIRKVRELGLQFWIKYPKDARKFKIFLSMALRGNYYHYWKNVTEGAKNYNVRNDASYKAPLDKEQLQEWKKVYNEMKSDLLQHYHENRTKEFQSYIQRLLIDEIAEFLTLSKNIEYRLNAKFDLDEFRKLLTAASGILNDSIDIYMRVRLTNLIDRDFISIYRQLGLDDRDLLGFIESLKNPANPPELQNWAMQRSSLFQLKKQPIKIRHIAMDGSLVNLDKFKGKVVLLDFWSTNCTACLKRMPYLKSLYAKYKDQGFVVVSIATDAEPYREKVEKIEDKIGADWPTLLIGGKVSGDPQGLTKKLWDKYGFSGVPQLLLLDKNGKLFMLNDLLSNGDIEPIIRQLINETL